MTQQSSSPLVQGADALDAAESRVEETLKRSIPDVAGLLRRIALALPGGGVPGAPQPEVPAPGVPVPGARAPQPAVLSVLGSPTVS
jgi:hypothetical protein